MKKKSVQSINLHPSVIQTSYDSVKALVLEFKVMTRKEEGSEFIIQLPI